MIPPFILYVYISCSIQVGQNEDVNKDDTKMLQKRFPFVYGQTDSRWMVKQEYLVCFDLQDVAAPAANDDNDGTGTRTSGSTREDSDSSE